MGRTAARARVCCRAQLFGNGPARGTVDGEIGCDCGFVGRAEGSGADESWGVFGVDWYVFVFLSFGSFFPPDSLPFKLSIPYSHAPPYTN